MYLLSFYYVLISENFWFITPEISKSGLREFSTVKQDEMLATDLGWQYNRYPNCRTDG